MERLTTTDPAAVGRYRTIAELGRGGMGRVLLSSAPDGQLVALKQVRTQFVEDDGFRARFRREVEASRKVSGAHTSAVIDADSDAAEPWLTSEFVPGPSLQQAVDALGVLPEEAVLRLAAGLARALVDIHRAGLVHRDLKPSNVLLSDDGPRVIDFGIARATDSEGGSELTHSGWLVGSPGFMSPEQAEGLSPDTASDVFSLGTVLVMACTGRCPFAGPGTPQTLYNVVHKEPDLSVLPARIRPIVAQCLAKDPGARPSPAQLLEAIGRLTPAARPWPTEVHELIAAQQAEIERLKGELEERASVREDESALSVEQLPADSVPPGAPESPPTSPRTGAVIAAVIAVCMVITAAVLAVTAGHGGGTSTTADPTQTDATVQEASADPVGTTLDRSTEDPATSDPEPSTATEPSSQAPTPQDTEPSRQPATIFSCGGLPLDEPSSLLIACGDGKDMLKELTWTDWGTPTAFATGVRYQVSCVPSCATGRELHFPATVYLTGLVEGSYTAMQVRSPQSPTSPVSDYRLDSHGPVNTG
ncbi:protein kinase [Streptomyces sp. NPDC051994]|uniref:serine/threonine-protein kinase n=1 Tax=unclassified Streptomyces TaxID=2593676 RepID=UPI003421765A